MDNLDVAVLDSPTESTMVIPPGLSRVWFIATNVLNARSLPDVRGNCTPQVARYSGLSHLTQVRSRIQHTLQGQSPKTYLFSSGELTCLAIEA